MGTWEVTPSDGVTIGTNGQISFPSNTTDNDITYTVKYTDDNGCFGTKDVKVEACGDDSTVESRTFYHAISLTYEDMNLISDDFNLPMEFPYKDRFGDCTSFGFHFYFIGGLFDESKMGGITWYTGHNNKKYLVINQKAMLYKTEFEMVNDVNTVADCCDYVDSKYTCYPDHISTNIQINGQIESSNPTLFNDSWYFSLYCRGGVDGPNFNYVADLGSQGKRKLILWDFVIHT